MIAVASSLTELFAPDLMATRLAAFERFYPWIDPGGLEYFRRRLTQAGRDSEEALEIVLEHCGTAELRTGAVRALEFKCDVLWSMLDAIAQEHRQSALSIEPGEANSGLGAATC
jgi:pyrroloquinoline-quinone synthase